MDAPKRIQRKREPTRSAISLMYNALLAIGALDEFTHSPQWCIEQARQIAGLAIKEMNVEHTEEVQRALGIGEYGDD